MPIRTKGPLRTGDAPSQPPPSAWLGIAAPSPGPQPRLRRGGPHRRATCPDSHRRGPGPFRDLKSSPAHDGAERRLHLSCLATLWDRSSEWWLAEFLKVSGTENFSLLTTKTQTTKKCMLVSLVFLQLELWDKKRKKEEHLLVRSSLRHQTTADCKFAACGKSGSRSFLHGIP